VVRRAGADDALRTADTHAGVRGHSRARWQWSFSHAQQQVVSADASRRERDGDLGVGLGLRPDHRRPIMAIALIGPKVSDMWSDVDNAIPTAAP